MYRIIGKRLFDTGLTAASAIVLAPLMSAIALMVRLKLGGPILYKQQRPGLNGVPFTIYKFRSMTDERDAEGNLLPDAARLTGFGKFLRSSSLDELPELFNVIKGEMSLVGPRPLLSKYLARYTPAQMRRHEALPGITGWAQINGRNNLSWESKFEFDLWYVEHCSLLLDLKILLRTVRAVFTRDGVNAPFCVTSPEFIGTAACDQNEG